VNGFYIGKFEELFYNKIILTEVFCFNYLYHCV